MIHFPQIVTKSTSKITSCAYQYVIMHPYSAFSIKDYVFDWQKRKNKNRINLKPDFRKSHKFLTRIQLYLYGSRGRSQKNKAGISIGLNVAVVVCTVVFLVVAITLVAV